MLYDISPRIDAGIPVWPGDAPYARRFTWAIAEGAPVNVSEITTTPHLGAHADAPLHTDADGKAIDAMPLEAYWGPCRVLRVPPVPLIEPAHLRALDVSQPPRLLLKTQSVHDRGRFPEVFSALSPALARLLGERGVLLVGIDTPSVDPFASKTLDAHHILWQHGIANLENLMLDDVPDGVYELSALPLRLAACDASPVRAVLRSIRHS